MNELLTELAALLAKHRAHIYVQVDWSEDGHIIIEKNGETHECTSFSGDGNAFNN